MARLDTGWHANPKILKLGFPGMGLHAWSISYCDHALSDGFIPEGAWPALAGANAAVKSVVSAGLWEPVEGGYQLHDYTDYNRSRAQVDAYMAAKIAAGQAGGRASAQARARAPAQANGQQTGKHLLKQTRKQNPTPGPGPGFNSPAPSGAYSGMPESVNLSRAREELLAEHERRLAQSRAAATANKNSWKDDP